MKGFNMDRLTYQTRNQNQKLMDRYSFRNEYKNYKYQYENNSTKIELILNQLGRYEDTGFTPEEINQLNNNVIRLPYEDSSMANMDF